MKKPLLLSALALLFMGISLTSVQAQDDNLWQSLADLTFKKEYDEMLGFKVDVPVFSETLKQLEGQEVTVKGYIIPVEGYKSHTEFVFSAYPYNMCFFCGRSGPGDCHGGLRHRSDQIHSRTGNHQR